MTSPWSRSQRTDPSGRTTRNSRFRGSASADRGVECGGHGLPVVRVDVLQELGQRLHGLDRLQAEQPVQVGVPHLDAGRRRRASRCPCGRPPGPPGVAPRSSAAPPRPPSLGRCRCSHPTESSPSPRVRGDEQRSSRTADPSRVTYSRTRTWPIRPRPANAPASAARSRRRLRRPSSPASVQASDVGPARQRVAGQLAVQVSADLRRPRPSSSLHDDRDRRRPRSPGGTAPRSPAAPPRPASGR